jgi:hypothetical protein
MPFHCHIKIMYSHPDMKQCGPLALPFERRIHTMCCEISSENKISIQSYDFGIFNVNASAVVGSTVFLRVEEIIFVFKTHLCYWRRC